MPLRYRIVIPVLNQLAYTRQAVDSLLACGVPAESILVIDNASNDETPQWLAGNREIPSLRNPVNFGCGGAWTQGALLTDSDWVVLLNNDVKFVHNAVDAMLDAADRLEWDVVSPAVVENDLDYEQPAFTTRFVERMSSVVREGWFHGVAFAVRRTVFHRIGYLDTDRALHGREDAEFLVRCARAGIRTGTVGAAMLHHFGMITQTAMKREAGVRDFGDHRYLYRKLGMGWWGRQQYKWRNKAQRRRWIAAELAAHGMTLHMQRQQGQWIHR
jgi:N-acetylglucosaminyl-diphospho-decaprenol L-rhamnosyltransferase